MVAFYVKWHKQKPFKNVKNGKFKTGENATISLETKTTFAPAIIIYCHLNFTAAATRLFFFKLQLNSGFQEKLWLEATRLFNNISQTLLFQGTAITFQLKLLRFEFKRIKQCVSIGTHCSIIQWFIRWIAQLLLLKMFWKFLNSSPICRSTERGANTFWTSHLNHVDSKTLWKLRMNMICLWIIQCKWHATV